MDCIDKQELGDSESLSIPSETCHRQQIWNVFAMGSKFHFQDHLYHLDFTDFYKSSEKSTKIIKPVTHLH